MRKWFCILSFVLLATSLRADEEYFIHLADSSIIALPKSYVGEYRLRGGELSISLSWGEKYSFSGVKSVSEETPQMPRITAFGFSEKCNDLPFNGAEITGRIGDTVRLSVGCIGKRVVPSFEVSGEDVKVYVDGIQQESGVTGRRFEEPVTYVISSDKLKQAVRVKKGNVYELVVGPYRRDLTVCVTYLSDRADRVPAVYINTGGRKPVPRLLSAHPLLRLFKFLQPINTKKHYTKATIRIDGAGVFPDLPETAVNIKGRGNSSWKWPKKPYRLKFDEKQSPFGLTASKNWVLLSNFLGNSMMTNAIAMKAANMVGTVNANHMIPVDVYLNGKYVGSYNFTEKVDAECAAMVELDSYFNNTYKFRSGHNLPVNVGKPDFSNPNVPITMEELQESFNRMEAAVMSGTDEYTKLIDLPSACRFFFVNELTGNLELRYPKSCYIFNEDPSSDESPWVFGPVWDFDWGYGYDQSRTFYRNGMTSDYFVTLRKMRHSDSAAVQFWYNIVAGSREARECYDGLWQDFMDGQLDELLEYIEDYYRFAHPSFEKDYKIWNRGCRDQGKVAARAKEWISARAGYCAGQFHLLTLQNSEDRQ